jgi:deoxyribonuclease-1
VKFISVLILFSLLSFNTFAANETNQSFSKAKKMLGKNVYQHHRVTLYCDATFDSQKKITAPTGFTTDKYIKRAKKVEWEHVVPAENFGRTFVEWREGSPQCINRKGKSFKGRRCAEKVNVDYRYMQADMFNLYPAIGAVNGMRSNYNFTMLPDVQSHFGSCPMKISNKKAEPPVRARGQIARTYLYMEQTYSRYNMSRQQRQLMNAWDKMYPVDSWECQRAQRISRLQNSNNMVVQSRCEAKYLW